MGKTPDRSTAAFIVEIQDLLFNDRFMQARQKCDEFISKSDSTPEGYLLKAATLLAEMTDAEEDLYAKQFKNLIHTAIELCNSRLDTCSDRAAAYHLLWRGHAHVYRSLWESRFGSFTAAIKYGVSAHKDYGRGLKYDSSLYDLYFGLGNYHYWKSVKAGILRTLGLFSNDIEKGISELKLAIDSGSFFSEAAKSSLIWILVDRKEYDSAAVLAEQMLEKYPSSRTLRWPLGIAFYNLDRNENAIGIFTELRRHFSENPGNFYNLIECDYYLYKCYRKLERDDVAEALLLEVEQYGTEIPRTTQRKQRSKLNYLRGELRR